MLSGPLSNALRFARRCRKLLAPHRAMVFGYIALSLLAAVTEGAGVSLLVPVLDASAGTSSLASTPIFGSIVSWSSGLPTERRLAFVGGALFIVICLRGVLIYTTQLLAEILPLRVQHQLMATAYDSVLNVEIGYLARHAVGPLTDSVVQLPIRISGLILQTVGMVYNGVLALAYTALMVLVSWKLTLASVAFFLFITLLLRFAFSRPIMRDSALLTAASARNASLMHETINGLRLIRLSAGEATMRSTFRESAAALITAKIRISRLRSLPSPVFSTAAGAFICLLFVIGDVFVPASADGNWISSILLFNILVFRVLSPISGLNTARHHILGDLHALDEYDRLMGELNAAKQPTGKVGLTQISQEIRFQTVSYTYPGSDVAALNGVSLTIPKGRMVALVGPSGSGKSTLAALIARLYDPDGGRISVDGVDLREVDVSAWHRLIGFVSQEAFVFNDTLASNMRFAKANASDAEIWRALERAAAAELVSGLPEGIGTVLGERGSRLSGGQVQRISLARAILSDPQLLILDEATSSLDSVTEQVIRNAVEEMRGSRTIVAIAHRLSTIARADLIVVLENGSVVETGTHQELQAANGLYQNLLHHQIDGVIS